MNYRFTAIAAVALFILSGCTGKESSTPTETDDGDLPILTNTTNKIHLLAAPKTSLLLPNGTEPTKTGSYSAVPMALSYPARWMYKFNSNATLTGGEAILFLRTTDTTLHLGQPGITCTWRSTLTIGDTRQDTSCEAHTMGPISAGDFEVKLPLGIQDPIEVTNGTQLVFDFYSFTSSVEEHPTLYILGGTSKFDSRLEITGANETLPAGA